MNRQVLIVDDDPSVLMTVQMVLEDGGFDVTVANSGTECIGHLRNGFKGLMLMDAMMPQMSGWDTIKVIKDENLLGTNLICMLTAVETPDEKLDDLKEMVVDYIKKPFDPDHLVAMVSQYLSYMI